MSWKLWRVIERGLCLAKLLAWVLAMPCVMLAVWLEAAECWAHGRMWMARSRTASPEPANGFTKARRVK